VRGLVEEMCKMLRQSPTASYGDVHSSHGSRLENLKLYRDIATEHGGVTLFYCDTCGYYGGLSITCCHMNIDRSESKRSKTPVDAQYHDSPSMLELIQVCE
jgi:hypothetical protein